MSRDTKYNKKNSIQKVIPNKSNLSENTFEIPSWAIYGVLVLTALVYTRALFNDFANWDDDVYLFNNSDLKNFSFDAVKSLFTSFYLGHYHPLTMLTYFFEYHLFGLKPFPFHLFNVLLHLANVWLVYRLTQKLSGKRFTSVFVAAMFALHPMHVESVAWISERKDVLYTLFYLAALLVYLRYINNGFKFRTYLFCLLLFIFSLLSKSVALTLPVLMIAIDLYKGRKLNRRMILEKLPFLAFSALAGFVALKSQGIAYNDVSMTYAYSITDRIFLLAYALAYYIVEIIIPFNLSAIHYYPDIQGGYLPWVYYAALPFLLFLIWPVIRRTSFRREKLFGVSIFLIVISIMLQIVSVGSAITAERYTYVSYIGLFYIAGQWIPNLKKTTWKRISLIICGIFLLLFSYLTWDRISVWKNGIVLFTDVIKKYPECYHGYKIRGNYKFNMKDYQGALKDYDKTLQINPSYVETLRQRSYVLLNYKNDYQGALRDLNLFIQQDSTSADAYNNRGMSYKALNDTAAAMRDYNKAIALKPDFQNAYNNRAALKIEINCPQSATADINKAIELNPNDGHSYTNRAIIGVMLNDFSAAIQDCNTALHLDPKDYIALFYRGLAYLNLNNKTAACADWEKASELGHAGAKNMISQFCK
ncbi:MAG TPA: tetratricopeptide repeat protein [Bacteroidales bacterium]|nr:tetratricopeptide repeat protein [Bacteroidales bacterium]